jgi:kynurenine/2-aminoadipate aminotransferase
VHALQVVVSEMLEAWGEKGFEEHVASMQHEYGQRAAVMQAAAKEHLAGLAKWQPPSAGMFLWLRILGVPDAGAILGTLRDAGVILVPGLQFWQAQFQTSQCTIAQGCISCVL